jgi:hypothetical protein
MASASLRRLAKEAEPPTWRFPAEPGDENYSSILTSGSSVLILGIELSKGCFFVSFQLTKKVLTVTTPPALTPFLNAHRAIPLSQSGRGAKNYGLVPLLPTGEKGLGMNTARIYEDTAMTKQWDQPA